MHTTEVSIPRSEFWSFGQSAGSIPNIYCAVSIPRSEFWSFGHKIGVEADSIRFEFQFLGRNSGRSDIPTATHSYQVMPVSIPRSEFWSFGLAPKSAKPNASSWFQFLGRNSGRSDAVWAAAQQYGPEFQFLGRNSGRSDKKRAGRVLDDRECFNSSVGILVVRTSATSASRFL